MSQPMTWEAYGQKCRDAGNLAYEVFACFSTPNQPGPPPADTLAAHKAYVASLETSGQLFLAGPLSTEDGTLMSGGGLLVFRVPDLETAIALAENDPVHKEGIRSFKIQAWRLNEGSPVPGLRLSNSSFGMV